MAKERATVSDEQRERMLIQEQIGRAAAEEPESSTSTTPPVEEGLKREEGAEKVVLAISVKPAASAAAPVFKMNALKPAVNPLKANPLKRPNVFKSAAMTSSVDVAKVNEKKRPAPKSAAEQLILEEQERKRRRMDRDILTST